MLECDKILCWHVWEGNIQSQLEVGKWRDSKALEERAWRFLAEHACITKCS